MLKLDEADATSDRMLGEAHPLEQVMRYICKAKHRPSCEMMPCDLDEIIDSLIPVIQVWAKLSRDLRRDTSSSVHANTA